MYMYTQWNITEPLKSHFQQHEITILPQKEKDEYQMISLLCGIKYDADEHIYEKVTDSQTERTNSWLPKGRRRRTREGV